MIKAIGLGEIRIDGHKFLVNSITKSFEHDSVPEVTFKTVYAGEAHGILPEIKRVIFNDPATIVLWEDGTKTVVKCQGCDEYDEQTGLLMCIAKKAYGNNGRFNDVINEHVPNCITFEENLNRIVKCLSDDLKKVFRGE